MEKPKIIAVAHARDPAEKTPSSVEGWLDEGGLGYASQVGAVERVGADAGRGEEDDGDEVAGIGVVAPVCDVGAFGPFIGLFARGGGR